jgi:hypothetical protein
MSVRREDGIIAIALQGADSDKMEALVFATVPTSGRKTHARSDEQHAAWHVG